MKRKFLPIAVFSSLVFSGAALAELANNDASNATLNFSGKVTSSLCQINTDDVAKEIELGELSLAALKASGKGPAKSFSVGLINCDTTLNSISYTIAGQNNTGNNVDYLIPVSNDESAQGVGVFIQKNDGTKVTIGKQESINVVKDNDKALSAQSIPLQAYIGTQSGSADEDGSNVTAGTVNATAIMTIRTAA
ncbi:fimbrial protein [Escherichia albertii]|uniref:fimbrial protein n=1 Tax=Escherichia albertii TaxID=208962 RepID=UPI003D6FDDBB